MWSVPQIPVSEQLCHNPQECWWFQAGAEPNCGHSVATINNQKQNLLGIHVLIHETELHLVNTVSLKKGGRERALKRKRIFCAQPQPCSLATPENILALPLVSGVARN